MTNKTGSIDKSQEIISPENLSVNSIIETWRNPKGYLAVIAVTIIILLIVSVTTLVYFTGGTAFVWVHLMYIPLILAAAVFRIPGGILAALFAGLLLGPLMPLAVAKDIPQQTTQWLFRIGFFVLAATLSGTFSKWFNDQIDMVQIQAMHDLQTGLPNLLSLQKFFRHDLNHHPKLPVALAIINISNLQQIINTLSYRSAGDICLQIANRLQESTSSTVTFYKLQSNTYALTRPDIELPDFIALCKKIATRLEEPFQYEGIPVIINMHFGIAMTHEATISSCDIVQKASIAADDAEKDNLLYATYTKTFDTSSIKRLSLLGTMKEALQADELTLFLQPKASLTDRKIMGVEALIRWQHPTEGLIPPDQFIPEAEKTWLIHPLSLFALKAGLNQLKRWEQKGYNLTLAVNLTSHNIQDRPLITELIAMIQDYGIDASKLEIEITERSLVTDFKTAADVLTSLKYIGTKISIDDFGTGYSSSNYLRTLPIDTIKIDQSLIANLTTSPLSASLVKHMLGAAKDLNLTTVAEGVETEELFNLLGEMGCDLAQGYYINKALSEQDFEQWLSSSDWKI